LTSEVDRQFTEILSKHENTFARDSTDLGYCPFLEHDIDTGTSPPIKQSPRRPPLSAGDAENEIIDEIMGAGVKNLPHPNGHRQYASCKSLTVVIAFA